MPISSTDVSRAALRTSPISNTEINFERLPNKRALEGMELRYRDDRVASLRKVFAIALGFVILGQALAFSWGFAPGMVEWIWQKWHEIEGMPIVGGMLACLVLLMAASSLMLVPNQVRTSLAGMSLPMAAVAASGWVGFGTTKASWVVAFAGPLTFWLLVRPTVIAFQDSWLQADPRVTAAQLAVWRRGRKCGWTVPKAAEAGQIISRYFTYSSLDSVPGVWIAPSCQTKRIFTSAFLAGSVFVVAARISTQFGDFRIAGIYAFAIAVCYLGGMTAWAGGNACWLSAECEQELQGDPRTLFEQRLDRVRGSEHVSNDVITGAPVREAEHLFLGAEPWLQFPVLLHQLMFREHVYVGGRTGSGKTSMALILFLIQLIRGYRVSAGGWSEKSPVIVVDLKGDKTMFQTAKAEAEARGQKFRFFTLEPGKASFHFNPFLAFKAGSLTLPQLVQSLLDASGLYYGDDYGKRYYSERHRNLLTKSLESSSDVDDFRKLYKRIRTLYDNNKKEYSDGFELVSVVSGLTHYDQLITDVAQEQGDDTIRLDRVLQDREVVYFWLPTVKESVAANQVAKFVLFCLRAAASDRECAGEELRQAYVLIDEFQKVAGDNFQGILQQARSAGIAAILANQSLSDLKGSTWDLTSTIRTNTRTKLFFSVTDPEEAQAFRELAGEELHTFGVNEVEEIRSRLSVRDLASLSDHPKRLLLQVTSGSGYTQFGGLPIPVQTDWPISKELSDRRADMSWPSSPLVKAPAKSPAKPSSTKPARPAPATPAVHLTRVSPNSTPTVKEAFAKTIKTLLDQ